MNKGASELLAEIERSGSGSRAFQLRFWQALDDLSDFDLRRVLVAAGRRMAPVTTQMADRFPLAAAGSVRRSVACPVSQPSNTTAGRVLCVDDEFNIRAILRELLTDEGFDVKTAPNGSAALSLLDSAGPNGWRPDVILLDIDMPIMDGYAFARVYRDRGEGAPVIVITAGEQLPYAVKRTGAVAYVSKPFDLDELLDVVRRHRRAA